MRKTTMIATIFSLAAFGGLTACDVDIEDEGELPKVDVDVEGGKLPEVEIRGPEIEIGEQEITVPDIDVDLPKEEDNEPNVPEKPNVPDEPGV